MPPRSIRTVRVEPTGPTKSAMIASFVAAEKTSPLNVLMRSPIAAPAWSAPLDGGEAVRLTSGKGDLLSGFATLPDGRLIFASTEEGAPDLWIAAADGSERHPIFASRAMRRGSRCR